MENGRFLCKNLRKLPGDLIKENVWEREERKNLIAESIYAKGRRKHGRDCGRQTFISPAN